MLSRLSAFAKAGPLCGLTFGRSVAGAGSTSPAFCGRLFRRTATNYPEEHTSRVSPLSRRFGKAQPAEIDATILNDTVKLEELSVKGKLVHVGHEKKVGYWLLLCAGAVFGMIILGGYTRLSKSGLSMVKWKPIEYSYPRSQAQWEEEFEHYKKFPEFQLTTEKIDLERFKSIFLVEYAHRVYGSSLGVLFSVPLAYFWIRGYLKKSMKFRMLGLLALGGSQGLIGWWMVRSGLGPKPQYHREPRVSVYRLSVHLTTAMTIYSFLLWNGFTLLRNPPETVWRGYRSYEGMLKGRKWAIAALHTLYLTIVAGSVVAGLDAGKVFNTWPLMNGAVIPSDYKRAELPWIRNMFENMSSVQTNHRFLAYTTYTLVLGAFVASIVLRLPRSTITAAGFAFLMANMQAATGIYTVLNQSPLHHAWSHQMCSLVLLGSLLFLLQTLRRPNKLVLRQLQLLRQPGPVYNSKK